MNNLSKSREIAKEGFKYLFNATFYEEPIIEKGDGAFVWDVDGNKYMDLNGGQFCMTFGHGYKPFIEAVNHQMSKIWHTNTATLTPEVFEAAKKMAEINDFKLSKTLFLSTGSEANEAALRYAKFITGKSGVVALSQGYHGLTLASQAATMGGKWVRPAIPGMYIVTTPDYLHANAEISEHDFIRQCIDELRGVVESKHDSIAAMLMEPIIGVGGMADIPKEYLKVARELCDRYGIILIFDECQCGFGRSGHWFVYQEKDVIPDMVTTAKAMAMGIAVSAVTMSEKTAEKIEGKLVHFSSHQNDPLSAAVVCFVIDEINRLGLVEENKKKGANLLNAITEACSTTKNLINPRGAGLMCAFDIDDHLISDYRTYSGKLIKAFERNGVLIQAIRQGRTFRVMPSYLIKDKEIEYFKRAMVNSIKEADLDLLKEKHYAYN